MDQPLSNGGTAHSPDAREQPPLNIFISYRRGPGGDSGRAKLLYEALAGHFGRENVFFDIADIRDGEDFVSKIRPRLLRCNVVLAVIGPRWATTVDERDHPALFDRRDWVRMEIETALKRRPPVHIVPVLVDGAEVPDWRRLPRTIKRLVEPTNARVLHHESWDDDVENFAERLAKEAPLRLAELAEEYERRRRPPAHDSSAPRRSHRSEADAEQFEDVAKWIARGEVVTFLGPGVNASDRDEPWQEQTQNLPAADELAQYLAETVGCDYPDARRLAEVSEYALLAEDNRNLHQRLKAVLDPPHPTSVHRYLANLPGRLEELGFEHPYQVIVTSNYDNALEQAFEDANEDFHLAVYSPTGAHAGRFVHVPYDRHDGKLVSDPGTYDGFGIGEDNTIKRGSVIIKIRGALQAPSVEGDDPARARDFGANYVLTADDHIDFMSQVSSTNVVPVEIRQKLLWSRPLFLGCPISDWSTRVLLHRIWAEQRPVEGWAVEGEPVRDRERWKLDRKLWKEFDVDPRAMSLSEYVRALDEALQAHAADRAPA